MLKHVKRVRGYYYWRKRVPADLFHVFNHRELKISLHTADRKTAKSAREHYTHEYKKLVNLIRSHIMDTDDIIKQILDNPDQATVMKLRARMEVINRVRFNRATSRLIQRLYSVWDNYAHTGRDYLVFTNRGSQGVRESDK
jgi:hypothetical protein